MLLALAAELTDDVLEDLQLPQTEKRMQPWKTLNCIKNCSLSCTIYVVLLGKDAW